MLIAVGVVCAYGIFGPIADNQITRNDKLIEANLPTIGEVVSTYASDNNRLPKSLDNLTLTGDAKKLVTDKLVTYKIEGNSTFNSVGAPNDFYYQLCVTYKKASTDQDITPTPVYNSSSASSSSTPLISTGSNYSDYVTTIPHPAGDKCYKLMTYNNDVTPILNTNN
jgi:hypothetical protein